VKQCKTTIIGRSDSKGNMRISEKVELDRLASDFPNSRFIITVELIEESSKNMLGFYYKKVVPDFQRLYREVFHERFTLQDTDIKLRQLCASETAIEIPKEEAGGYKFERYRPINELNSKESWEFLQHLEEIKQEFKNALKDK